MSTRFPALPETQCGFPSVPGDIVKTDSLRNHFENKGCAALQASAHDAAASGHYYVAPLRLEALNAKSPKRKLGHMSVFGRCWNKYLYMNIY